MELNERILEAALMNELVCQKIPVTVTLINGTEYEGLITRNDVLVIALAMGDTQKIIYKHSVASVTPHTTLKSAQPRR